MTRAPHTDWHLAGLLPPSNPVRSGRMHCPQWIMILSMGAVLALFPDASGLAQDPAAPPAGGVPDSQALPAAPGKPGKKRYSHANDFLIRGTVFTDKAYTFPGVLLRVRRAG